MRFVDAIATKKKQRLTTLGSQIREQNKTVNNMGVTDPRAKDKG